ncbi:hypothetical protein R4536_15385 [Vibrio cholerae]|uniref:hypothetical protein n=1 Tax=Vibrio cholerae TaxID=666 RepID=UPI0008938173|nr:hypothetical protein [Vibrio cholerae]EGR0144031.1 hypothetical protein [Vibrio cholerae]EGR2394505.1 hypothetical protein [Vibrio cholerae]EIC2299307.1 hypothetical protein [Vibrio cholerae]EIE9613250.1 hypothetical protein [Vibrio cholerae]EJF1759271.1 hypothetical protein [Vibrio cholerae]
MELLLPEFIQKNTLEFSFFLALSLLGFSIKLVRAMISFYEEVLIKRYFNRLNSLSEHLSEDSKTKDYISQLKENEVFRLASGIRSSPEKSKILIEIYLYGVADNRDLKRIQRFIKPLNGKVNIETGFFDKLQITYSLLAMFYLLISGIALGGPHFISENGSQVLAGIAVMTMMTVAAAVVGTDFRTYRTLKRVRNRLIDLEIVANPNSKLMWSLPWRKS